MLTRAMQYSPCEGQALIAFFLWFHIFCFRVNQAHLEKWDQQVRVASKAPQVPKESQFRALWYVISSIAFLRFLLFAIGTRLTNRYLSKTPKPGLCIDIILING